MTLRAKMTMSDSQWYPYNLNLYLNNNMEEVVVFKGLQVLNSDSTNMFFCSRNAHVTFVVKSQLKIISFQLNKHWYLIHTWSDKVLKGIVLNLALRSLRRGPIEITLTAPLIDSMCVIPVSSRVHFHQEHKIHQYHQFHLIEIIYVNCV